LSGRRDEDEEQAARASLLEELDLSGLCEAAERGRRPLCPDPGCGVVYFGAAGRLVGIAELRVHPGSKDGGELLCYCLQLRKQDLRLEVTAPTRIMEQITVLVRMRGSQPEREVLSRGSQEAFAEDLGGRCTWLGPGRFNRLNH
jgi:hypothetical protein